MNMAKPEDPQADSEEQPNMYKGQVSLPEDPQV